MQIELSKRQEKIIEIVKRNQPITSQKIADKLGLTRSTLRSDLSILTMAGILDARPRVGYFFTGKTKMSYVADEISKILVEDIASIPVVLDEKTSIYDAIVFMFLEDIGSIYIISDGFLSGVVSRKDIIKYAMGGLDLHEVPVGVIMTRMPNIIVIKKDESLISAARKLIQHEIDGLPVVEVVDEEKKQYKVVGRITKTSITRVFVDLGDER